MNSELVWQFALQPAERPMGANFKKAFYKAHLCRVLFKSIAVGDTIYADCYTICQTLHFSLLLFH